ncbi:MAG: histidine kinase [Candidatus Marinimicrobia bacterium]|nr:histidine kinase [Candidatus Neomarinimicrobiota bacterium]
MKNHRDQKLQKNIYRISLHCLFWVFIIAAYTFLYGFGSRGAYSQAFVLLICTLPIYMGATYYTIYKILPDFLFQKKYRTFAVHFIYMSLISTMLELLIIMFVFVLPVHPFGIRTAGLNPIRIDIGFLMVGIYLVILSATAIKLLKHWYAAQQRNLILSREMIASELQLLKSQIHPHFLFNTLNNLYALALEKSDKTPEVILKLSELLDYMLYECNRPQVALEREIEMLHNYIAIESLRYDEHLKLSFNIEGNPAGKQVAPLLLLPFIENSFKHGKASQQGELVIDITISVQSNHLNAVITNSIAGKPGINDGTELGLQNVQKRLDLLYPQRHSLVIQQTEDQYSVNLMLELEAKPGDET